MTEQTNLTERLQLCIRKGRNGFLKNCKHTDDELLSEAWIFVAEGKVKEAGDVNYAVRKAVAKLDKDSQVVRGVDQTMQLPDTTIALEEELGVSEEFFYDCLPMHYQGMFRYYVQSGMDLDKTSKKFQLDHTYLSILEVVTSCKRVIKEAHSK